MRASVITVATVIAVFGANSSNASDLDGWCFPGDACTGEVPITSNGYFTCEENCALSNPVAVRGMNAILYDVECSGDSETYHLRILFKEIVGADGQDRMVALASRGPHLSDEGIVELHRCE